MQTNLSESQRVLLLFKGKKIEASILYADMVGSTATVAHLEASRKSTYYKLFLDEMTRVVRDFGGLVLKHDGDSVIAFFPSSNGFVDEADNTLHCGLMIVEVCKGSLSPYLESIGLPPVSCRVSADFGEVTVMETGVDGFYKTTDLYGDVMNIASRILGKTNANQVFIGERLFKLVHSSYRTSCIKRGDQIRGLNNAYSYYEVRFTL